MIGFKCFLVYIKLKYGLLINFFVGIYIFNCFNNLKVVRKKIYKYRLFVDFMNRKIEIILVNFIVIFFIVIF